MLAAMLAAVPKRAARLPERATVNGSRRDAAHVFITQARGSANPANPIGALKQRATDRTQHKPRQMQPSMNRDAPEHAASCQRAVRILALPWRR